MKFVLIGNGYIAKRHIDSIKNIGGELIAISDTDRNKEIKGIGFETDYKELANYDFDWVSICTPNYLHQEMIEFFYKMNKKIICEKPLVINPVMFDFNKYYDNLFPVHQLRLMPEVIAVKEKYKNFLKTVYRAECRALINRGDWYYDSWKGHKGKSGGLLFNIGIHYLDLLVWILGDNLFFRGYGDNLRNVSAFVSFQNVVAGLEVSLMRPENAQERNLIINETNVDLNKKMEKLHTDIYSQAINGTGIRSVDVAKTYYLANQITQYMEEL